EGTFATDANGRTRRVHLIPGDRAGEFQVNVSGSGGQASFNLALAPRRPDVEIRSDQSTPIHIRRNQFERVNLQLWGDGRPWPYIKVRGELRPGSSFCFGRTAQGRPTFDATKPDAEMKYPIDIFAIDSDDQNDTGTLSVEV